jgi:hypothetical protein
MIRTHQPLFNAKVLDRALQAQASPPSDGQRAAAADWASRVRDLAFGKLKEQAIRSLFTQRIVVEVLGYTPVHPSEPFTVAEEEPIGAGSVDRALGRFSPAKREVVAPFELKGPKTRDLEAIMPGRAKSPIQQAWEYAIDTPGARWVLVSNCTEIRLYAFGRGRSAYERWNLAALDQPGELERLRLLLSSENLLGGGVDALLSASSRAEREITDTLYQDYKALRDRLIVTLDERNTSLDRAGAIEHAQTLLDRALFVVFAEKTGLLPRDILRSAFQARNVFAPRPIWDNYKSLFRAIDKGNSDLGIPAYNGGLFVDDPIFNALSVPDEVCESLARLGEYDFANEVSVLVLGRIFEQSISDLEAMHAEARGEPPPVTTKKKREGVVYTPEFVTRFIIERAIGHTLAERFDALLAKHNGARRGEGGDEILAFSGRDGQKNERAFWEAYQDVLRQFTVLDPACGSGAFLVAAFDFLAVEYKRVNERLADLGGQGTGSLFDPNHEILSGNLFGVDVSRESVEITKLSLWLKTARRGKALESLEANIRVGNSLIEDSDYHQRAFTWREAFPTVLERGGFDAVVGNPPYVRMELIKPFKPYLKSRYAVAADRADLYAYFYELGLRHLKPGGRLGYISSSTFFRTGSGSPLRQLLAHRAELEEVVDFGDLQLFEGVTTYPAITILKRPTAEVCGAGQLRFLQVRDNVPEELSRTFEKGAIIMPRARLGRESWQFEDDAPARLRAKLREGRPTLRDVYGAPLWGIKTGLNDAFVVNRATRDRLVVDDAHAALLVPFLRGEDVKRWRVESEDFWLINIPKGRVRIEEYPAIREHLLPYKERLEKRATKQAWFELQQAQLAYQPRMMGRKVIYPHFADEPSFTIDEEGYFSNNKTFFVPDGDYYLLALLNSLALWFVFAGFSTAVRGGYREHAAQWLEQLPIPQVDEATRTMISGLAKKASSAAMAALAVEREMHRRIPDLCPPGRTPKLTGRLYRWGDLDFAAFRAEVRKALRTDIPVRERNDWEAYLSEQGKRLATLRGEIRATEEELHEAVCGLFGLTKAEATLLS